MHRAHVANLSLQLFDALRPIHRLSDRDRSLLQYAALLHDISGTPASHNHPRRSERIIFADEELLFDFTEQGIIGLVVPLHRQKPGKTEGGLLSLFTEPDRQRVRILASLLRIADGLDVLHDDTISSLKISVSASEIVCEVIALGDVTIEKARAQAKSDLFNVVFQKPLVIR